MVYNVSFRKQAFNELAKIKELYYSNIKQSIYKLVDTLVRKVTASFIYLL